jgi:two-component system, chemotaxis family, sensor kinase CheA
MFMTFKRPERKKPEPISVGGWMSEAILKNSAAGIFFLGAEGHMLPQVSHSLAAMFRREDFANLTFEKLLAPVVTAKALSAARRRIGHLIGSKPGAPTTESNRLHEAEVRLPNPDGSFATAQYAFQFSAISSVPEEPQFWMVSVTDITTRAQSARELEDLRAQLNGQAEILRSVLQNGKSRFAAFLQKTDASMKAINAVLKKPAREQASFREKLEETLNEVDRVRKDGAALKLTALETAARRFEDSLQELRSRSALSGSDFLPLAVMLDQLYGQFALLRSLIAQAGPVGQSDAAAAGPRTTDNGTQIIDTPKFVADMSASYGSQRMAQAGSLESTLKALTEHVAQEHSKTVILECTALQSVPPKYQGAVKNIAIQLIRNAVMHGIEAPEARVAAAKPAHGTLRLEFKSLPDGSFELMFQDDGRGLDPDQVRATAVARGVLTEEAAAKLRDRQAIKLIFKSRYTTMADTPDKSPHGKGMALVRRYIHDAGGRIALASLLGHETRFKLTLPGLDAPSESAPSAQVA